jgi:glycosyltransferase involved in cell wall biosynthesis
VRLRVCYPFVGDTVGGSHISSSRLIRHLPREVAPLVVLHQRGTLAAYLDQENIDFEWAPAVRLVGPGDSIADQIATMAAALPRLVTFLRERRIDVVHTNDARMHLTWGLAARFAGARFIWHQRSTERSRRLSIYCRLASSVLTVSDFCKSQLAPAMSQRAEVVLNPFDPTPVSFERAVLRRSLLAEFGAKDESTKIISFISNLSPRKQAGRTNGPLSRVSDVRRKARAHEEGVRPPDRLTRLAGAMQAHWPALYRETGLLIKPDDPAAFADAVTELLDRPEFAREIAEKALQRAQERFSDATHVRSILHFYGAGAES